jgi:hypothetical protein
MNKLHIAVKLSKLRAAQNIVRQEAMDKRKELYNITKQMNELLDTLAGDLK